MMDIESEILDRELDAIFEDCARDSLESAQVLTLIDACVDRYADGQPEIKNILLQRMDPHRLNPYISKSVFKRRVTEWMLAASGDQCGAYNPIINSEDNLHGSPEEYEHSITCSTPLRTSPRLIKSKRLPFLTNDSEYDSSSAAQESHSLRHEVSVLKDRNDSLENSLSKAEQKVNSLETKLIKQDEAHKKQVRSLESEIHRLNSLLTEAQENSSMLQEKYDKLKNENLVRVNNEMLATAERQTEIEKNKEDLEFKVSQTNEEVIKKNAELSKLKSLLCHLKLELNETQVSKEAVEKELAVLKIQNESLLFNEEELNIRIRKLECEKQEQIREFSEAAELFQSLNQFNSLQVTETGEQMHYLNQEDNRESGISIKSEISDVSGFLSQTCLRIPRPYCEEKDTQTAWICTVEKGVQAVSRKLSIDSKECQTIGIWTKAPLHSSNETKECQTIGIWPNINLLPSLDSVETQTIEDWIMLTRPCMDFQETQTTEELTRFSSTSMGFNETQTTEESSSFSSTRTSSVCCYTVLSMFLVPVSAFILFIWMSFDRNLGILHVEYPRGLPPS